MIIVKMFYIFYFSLLMWILGMFMFLLNQSIMFEWMIMSMFSYKLMMVVLVDWMSLLFMSMVMLISLMIFIYSMGYMKDDISLNWFYNLMIMFVVSMLLFIISPNLVSIMFGWDGLGLVSYLLVIYYQSQVANYSGMVTILMNRIGDIMILMVIGLMMIYGSWNLFNVKGMSMMFILFMMAGMTKSAQFPFSSWLPMAMVAPTPVSALVHSSTLVTAGIYLMIRYWDMTLMNKMNLLLKISVLTMVMAGMMTLWENDLKKIIALSTLGQMSLMMMILSMDVSLLAFYHLLIHAIFKSLMFMSVGSIIHVMNNNQDIRLMGKLFEYIPFSMISFLVSLVSLCGIPFMSGFYSKDLLVEMMYIMKLNFFIFMMIMISLMLTLMYSVRVIMYMYSMDFKVKLVYYQEDKIMSVSMIVLILMSIFFGSLMNWLFFMEMIFLELGLKILVMLILMLGLVMILIFNFLGSLEVYKEMSGYVSSMMFYNFMLIILSDYVMNLMMILNKFHNKWYEYYSEKLVVSIMVEYQNYFMNYKYKIYLYMCMIMFYMIMILIIM